MKTEICIIGAGPAGLMAAIYAARQGVATAVVESNQEAGRKLLVTGGGRCNFTHDLPIGEFVATFGKTGHFLRHCFHELSPQDVRAFFDERGLASVVEPDGCVFPTVKRAGDVRDLLVHEARTLGADLLYGARVQSVSSTTDGFTVRTAKEAIGAKRLIIATGGLSWPQTGSTGDGYRFAKALGHDIVQTRPALVPLVTDQRWLGALAGVSIAQVGLHAVTGDGRKVRSGGALVFTQDGIGGPAAQDLSRFITDDLSGRGACVEVRLDLSPSLDRAELDSQLREQFAVHPKKGLANILAGLIPKRLAGALCGQVPCAVDLPGGQVAKKTRQRLVTLLKELSLSVIGTRPIAEATVTRGGVAISQIHPQTMESKVRPGLFFAGEVVDLDGPCGGYNLQMCFSTGALAGQAAARSLPPA